MNFGEIWMLANTYAASILKHTIEQRHDDTLIHDQSLRRLL